MGFLDSFVNSMNKQLGIMNERLDEAKQYEQQYMGMSKEELRRIINNSSGAKKMGAMSAYRKMYGN